jgi:hypothetical protein
MEWLNQSVSIPMWSFILMVIGLLIGGCFVWVSIDHATSETLD